MPECEAARPGSATAAFTLLISTSGESVYHGLTAYNYLRGIPAQVTTHNFGSVDSIGVALYCAGQQRLCVPQARFLMHPVSMNFREGASYEEPKLLELVKSLRVDMENCASVVAANTRKTKRQTVRAMLARTALDPNDAVEWGLVHKIRQAAVRDRGRGDTDPAGWLTRRDAAAPAAVHAPGPRIPAQATGHCITTSLRRPPPRRRPRRARRSPRREKCGPSPGPATPGWGG